MESRGLRAQGDKVDIAIAGMTVNRFGNRRKPWHCRFAPLCTEATEKLYRFG